jgi:hypothetical protein
VTKLTALVGYGVVRLSWQPPRDADFDHVAVFESNSARGPLQASVYSGTGTSYVLRRFQNGTYVRFAVVSYDHAGNESPQAQAVASPAALLRSPRDGARLRRPPLLSWTPVRGATYYNVQLYRGSTKVLSAWPRAARIQLRQTWTYSGTRRLVGGSYRWYVWPGFGARARAKYGQLLGSGTFSVG